MNPSPNDPSDTILPISLCRLTPHGVASVVSYLKLHPVFASLSDDRLRAMAFACLAFGGTNDNNHAVCPGTLHPIHHETHAPSADGDWPNNMCERYLGLVMDQVSSISFAAVLCLNT